MWCLVLMFYLCFRVDVSWQYMVAVAHVLLVFLELMSHGST